MRALLRGNRAAAFVAGLLAVALALPGCAAHDASSPSAGLVTADLQKTRSDSSTTRLAISVTNHSAATITVREITITHDYFSGETSLTPQSLVTAGGTTDIRFEQPTLTCAENASDTGTAEIRYTQEGTEHTAHVTLGDKYTSVARVVASQCAKQKVEAIADLRLDDTLRVTGTGKSAIAHLTMVVTPRTATAANGGSVTLTQITSTILLHQTPNDVLSVGRTVSAGTEPFEIEIAVEPARCDYHAIAEDKVGTQLPVIVNVGEWSDQRILVAASTRLASRLYAYVSDTCGTD